MIKWFAHNPVAANLLMFAIIFGGVFSLAKNKVPLEILPEFELPIVNIMTTVNGATPASVEEGVTILIEEAIHDLEGIERLTSRSSEGVSSVVVEAGKGFNNRELLNDIKLRVDAISNFPTEAEQPIISIPVRVREVISIIIAANFNEKELRRLAEFHRDKLLAIKGIGRIEIDNPREFEITLEISPDTLDALDLSLQDVSDAINSNSLELSAGNIKSAQGSILIRTNAQAYDKLAYSNIPIVTTHNGRPILLGDIATISDGFDEEKSLTSFNDRPAIVLDVYRTGDQNAIQVADKVKAYLTAQKPLLANSVTLDYWRDQSKVVKSRLNTLLTSAWQGGLLVILLLTLFLRPSIAIWVCLGIPISFMGAILLMPFVGVTLNIVSMFAFILALGIVVDDAIVTGENVYRHMRMGKDSLTAAIEGTEEVSIPVTFGILTTVAAFIPLFMIEGDRGVIFAQIPAIVIPVLLFSLVESKLILPSHLRHVSPLTEEPTHIFGRVQQAISLGFESVTRRIYQPVLIACIHNKLITLSIVLIVSVLTFSLVANGWLKFSFFPRIESEVASASLTMPTPTNFEVTNKYIQSITKAAEKLQEKYRNEATGESLIVHILSTTGGRDRSKGSNLGRVSFEVLPPEERFIKISIKDLVGEWRRLIGVIPGAEQLSFRAELGRAGEPIEVQLQGPNLNELREVGDKIKEQLKSYAGLFDIQDNLTRGKDEFQLTLKPTAYNLGVTLSQISSQVRQAFFGLETQRIQRGRDEIKVMLRFPIQDRSSLEDLYNLPIRLDNDQTVRLNKIATITSGNSPSALYRVERNRTLSVTSDADKNNTDLEPIKADLRLQLDKLLINYPSMSYELEGEAKEQRESFSSVISGLFIVLLAVYALLAIPFKSYGQPVIVMSIIPIGIVGAILGHKLTGYNLSVISVLGMLALIGVVINDSLVLVDYINKQRAQGTPLMDAVLTAGARRFRPVILTSLTTFAGLTPLLLEKSTQAQFLKPMAISLGFGILFATAITLLIIPLNYVLYEEFKILMRKVFLKPMKN